MKDDKDKVHYRKAFNSPYLSSADIVEPTVLTIDKVELLPDRTKKTKDLFNTAFFQEKFIREGEELKPMILNATNSRTMKNLTGKPYLDDWAGTTITVYVDPKVSMMGSIVEGLRISTEPPITRKPDLLPDTKPWEHAIAAYKRDGNFDAIEKRMIVADKYKEMIGSLCKEES